MIPAGMLKQALYIIVATQTEETNDHLLGVL